MTFDIGKLHFDLGNPWLILMSMVLLVSLLLSSRAIFRRLFLRSAPRALLVLGLNTLAYLAVLLLLLAPGIRTTGGQTVVLVTEGADIENSPLPVTGSVYVAPGFSATPWARRQLSGADWLLDIGQLNFREATAGKLDVLGYGLEREQWEALAMHPEIEFEAPVIDGFHAMHWQRFLTEGDMLRLSGEFGMRDDNRVIEIRLLDPAGNVAATGRFKYGQRFSLEARVKTRGPLEYRLQAWEADELRSEQTVPFDAGEGNRLDIMIAQSAPSYETRQLKDFAAAGGHRVRVNTVISRAKYVRQSANLPADADTTFSPPVLAGQDVLVMDGRAFAELPPLQRQWLAAAVDGGLGLLLLADDALLDAFGGARPALLEGFELRPAGEAEPLALPRAPAGGSRDWQEPASVAAMRLEADDADVLINSDDGRPLVVRRPSGLGRIGISLVGDSHAWLTAGHRAQWSDYWSLLLAALARQRSDSFLLPPGDADFYRVDQRTALCALTRNDEVRIEVADGASDTPAAVLELQPAPDSLQSARRCAYFWPRSGGWHKVVLQAAAGGAVLDQKEMYVFAVGQWLDQLREQRLRATKSRAAGVVTPSPGTGDDTSTQPLGVFWLWLVLTLAASLLWLERKLDFM